ncbi:AI-2E family transporter [Thermosynechococcus sp. OHK43]|jgi:predicted PurR-regulated permease PerM|uniref:AI-2E family transporter n=1 Tax=Thermosynechococcus sp. OHK43 TaxID=2763133 RepID=UPI0025EE3BF1|nr:AI-2E family transporter [Thermosynechococcus sp. OHK43]
MSQSAASGHWWNRLSIASRFLIIGLAGPVLTLNFWAFATVLKFFGPLVAVLVLASLFAFLLNYPVRWMEEQGNPRGPSAIFVFLLALVLIAIIALVVVPNLFNQAQQLIARLPEWFNSSQRRLLEFGQWVDSLNLPVTVDVDALANQLLEKLKDQLQSLAREALNLILGTLSSAVDVLINLILTVVLTFYLLQHGDELWDGLLSWLPNTVRPTVSETIRRSFESYFIGQLVLGLCMGIGLTTIFIFLKVPYGLLFGVIIGVMALVPFGGTVGIISISLLVALQDVWLSLKVVGFAFLYQQFLENVVAPRIIGSFTGLNPVWVFLAILTGARASGLVGVLIAVPIAVVIKTFLVSVRSRLNTEEDVEATVALPNHPPPLPPVSSSMKPSSVE